MYKGYLKGRFNIFLILPFLLFTANFLIAQNLQISGGNNFSASLCSDGTIFAWGKNDAGQLGRDTTTNVKYPEAFSSTPRPVYLPVGNSLTMKQVDAGSGNTGISLGCDGSVWQWGGDCGNGNMGIGVVGGSCSGTPTDGSSYYSALQQVKGGAQGGAFLNNISYINASTQSSFAVEKTTGKVLAWGNNAASGGGLLGNGTNTNTGNTYTPSYVLTAAATPLTGIRVVEGTDYSGYALGNDGHVYSWGVDNNKDLGRPVAGDQYYAKKVQAWDYTKNDGSLVDLSNIIKMTGGDTHGMAIDDQGNLWSWGGDWGPGQRGWGATGTALPYATRVVAPNAPVCALNQWKIGPWLTGAIDISAGQQHSIVLMSDGRVVTFGSNAYGQLGNGTTTGSGCPVYVKTNATTDLTNIVSVSDGDLWSFALTSAGQVYVWGQNTEGELGIPGNVTNQVYAYLNPAIPTACAGSILPCPTASLGADVLKCPNIAQTLLAGANGDTYTYSWYSGPSSTGPWTLIGAANRPYAAGVGATISVTIPQYYRVVISDTRTYVANQCGPCTPSEDIMQLSDRTPPAAVGSAGTCGSNVCFTITSTGAIDNNAFDWYAAQTGGAKLNTSGTVNPLCTAKTNLTLNGSNYEIWADDKRVFQSTVGPVTAPCGVPTSSAGGSKYQQEFVLYDTATITSVDVYYKTYSPSASPDPAFIKIYSNDPNKNSTSTDGVNAATGVVSATFNIPRTSTTLQPITLSGLNLGLSGSSAGTKYWLEVSGISNGEFGEFTCAAAYPYSDAISGRDVMVLKGSTTSAQAVQQASYNAFGFNWKFTYQNGYPCGRFKLTAPSSTSVCLPVEFLYFRGENKGMENLLSWTTASEQNTSYFDIQKSYDGVHWVSIGRVAAAGHSNNVLEYSYADPVTRTGAVYYRIAEKDLDETNTYSKTISLEYTAGKIAINPNPNNGNFTIETNGALGNNTLIHVYDAIGKLVYQVTENFSSENLSKDLSLGNLAKGIYYINITNGIYSNTQKLIIE